MLNGVRQLLLLVLLAGVAATVWAGPRLVVEQTRHDFGAVLEGGKIEHVFVFANQGDQPLTINRVRSSCGCTAALVSSRELQPQQSGEIRATFNSRGFRGPVTKTISLYTNDLSQPVAVLELTGVVREVVGVKPQQVNFGTIAAGEEAAFEVTLVNQGDKTLQLATPTITSPGLRATLADQKLEPGEQTVLSIAYLPTAERSRFSGYIRIQVAAGELQKELRIPVYAMIGE
ncbi:MAG: DUF1573 domain-containing protein [Desulfuromonadales bacterium]|nr:DUF1573 domain-containing protein [Desulfuromonadales bacterium]